MTFRRIEAGSYYSYLPEGCRICRRGAKLVLFITGLCNSECFYCPISAERKGKDVVYANERPVRDWNDFLEELEMMSAEGVAITGGEPLMKIERVKEFVRKSKELDLHVHIYTSVAAKERVLERIADVDEIRFHPPELRNVDRYEESIKAAKKLGMDAGFEIPAVRFEPKIVEIVERNDAFLNVNQLEVSETNYDKIAGRYIVEDYYADTSDVVKRYEVVTKFHYCSARFKDVAQFRRRLIRMAMNHPDFYLVTRDGTLLCCRVEGEREKLELAERLLDENGYGYMRIDGGLETDVEVAEKIGELLKAEGLKVKVVERYPTFNRTLIESYEV